MIAEKVVSKHNSISLLTRERGRRAVFAKKNRGTDRRMKVGQKTKNKMNSQKAASVYPSCETPAGVDRKIH